WLNLHNGRYRRNGFGEFGAREFILSPELRSLLGLPTELPTMSSSQKNAHGDDVSESTVPENVSRPVDNAATETKMSHGTYRVNKVFKKEASFEEEAFQIKNLKDNDNLGLEKEFRVPKDLLALHSELGLKKNGIGTLMRLAKQCNQ